MKRSELVVAVSFTLILFTAPEVFAQQKHQIAYKNQGENTKYIQQHAIDVGDIPGCHQQSESHVILSV